MATARSRSGFSYALDSARRLVITQAGARRAGLAPVRVAEGRVITDRGHRIVYELERPLDPAGPSRVAFDGMWRMSPQHAVEFTGRRTDGPRGGFTLAGSVVTARARALIISLAGEGRAAPVLSLAGRWQVDAANRLSFLVDRGGRTDRLTFRGAWQLGPDHELAYQYREALEGRRGVRIRTLRFDGAWALGPGGRLRYSLEGSDDQALELRGSLEPARIEASGGKLGFRVGPRRLTLSGQWKLHPDRTVSFEVPMAGGRRGTLRFAAASAARTGERIEVELAAPRRERLGIAVRFSRKAFRDGRLFLQASRDGRDTAILGGVQLDF